MKVIYIETNDSETESETKTDFFHEFEVENLNTMPSVNIDKLQFRNIFRKRNSL